MVRITRMVVQFIVAIHSHSRSAVVDGFALRCGRLVAFANAVLITTKHI